MIKDAAIFLTSPLLDTFNIPLPALPIPIIVVMTTPSPQERGIGLTIVTDNPPSSITSWAETYNLDLGHSLLITDDPHLISWGRRREC